MSTLFTSAFIDVQNSRNAVLASLDCTVRIGIAKTAVAEGPEVILYNQFIHRNNVLVLPNLAMETAFVMRLCLVLAMHPSHDSQTGVCVTKYI